VDVRQIEDKFPSKTPGGLKELYDKGPQDAFYLVKFWADLNTNISDEGSSFYGVTTKWVFFPPAVVTLSSWPSLAHLPSVFILNANI
jgi:transcriptional enhancer factor